MTRQEHLDWCKERAREYLRAGDHQQALASMLSDLRKHPETDTHAGILLGGLMALGGHLSQWDKVRDFIEGFR